MEISLYQTVRHKQVILKEPIYCHSNEARLGYGYYFWEHYIEAAHWWGNQHYGQNYMIYQSYYDYHSKKYFDLVGNPIHREQVKKAYETLRSRRKEAYTIAQVLELIKKIDPHFDFWAIRAYPINMKHIDNKLNISFEKDNELYINLGNRVQMCVLDLNFLLDSQYTLVYPEYHNECLCCLV